jgi:putative FmdB family regulatory protein
MPIYAYKCSACGHTKDALQKMSDAPLTDCPACGQATFSKQVTAAGFQLKGGGWYVTDFKSGNQAAPAAEKKSTEGDAKPATADAAAAKPETKSDSTSASPAVSAPVAAPVAAPAKPAPSAAPAATT